MLNKAAKFFRGAYWAMALIPIGIILVIVSIFVFGAVNRIKDFPETEAVVSNVELYEEESVDDEGNHYDATFTVYVKYTVDGVEYENEYGVFTGYKIGDKFNIRYNPDDPNDIAQPNGIVLPIVILALGIAAIAGGVATSVVAIKKNKKLKEQEKEWANGN